VATVARRARVVVLLLELLLLLLEEEKEGDMLPVSASCVLLCVCGGDKEGGREGGKGPTSLTTCVIRQASAPRHLQTHKHLSRHSHTPSLPPYAHRVVRLHWEDVGGTLVVVVQWKRHGERAKRGCRSSSSRSSNIRSRQ
jgi:hypothetical protein